MVWYFEIYIFFGGIMKKILICIIALGLVACKAEDTKISQKAQIATNNPVENTDQKPPVDNSQTDTENTTPAQPAISDDEKKQIYDQLNGQILSTSFFPSSEFTELTFGPDGQFEGRYSSTTNFDGIDYGRNDLAVEKYYINELHYNECSGKFVIEEKIAEGIYKVSLKDYKIHHQPGFDEEEVIKYWVEKIDAMDQTDTYELLLPDTKVPDEILAREDLAQYFTPTVVDNDIYLEQFKDTEKGHTTGFVLYNKTQEKTFADYDLW